MGEVYRARDTRLDRVVAIKVLSPERVKDEDRKRRFVQEARTVSSLNHPNIVQLYDVVSINDAEVLVLEYVPGRTLEALIPKHGMKPGEAVRLALQIADGVSAAHAAGVIHRDLKPANVMVNDKGTVKLLDFGLAKLVEGPASPAEAEDGITRTIESGPHTEEGKIAGTLAYMSPEQAEGKSLDARTDIFSFGCVLYEMLAGHKAFARGSRISTLSAILRDEPPALGGLNPGLPRDLVKIVERCLRKDRDRRPQTMLDVRNALEEWKEESGSQSSAAAMPARTGFGRRQWALAVVALVVVVSIVAAAWFRRAATPPPMAVTPLTTYPGSERFPSLSPDGNQVAFAWDGPEHSNSDIYVKLIGSGEPLRLTTDPADDLFPAWSPDGRQIAFVRQNEKGTQLMLIPPLGGAERRLAAVHAAPLSWSPDGKWIACSVTGGPGLPPRLALANPESGEIRELKVSNKAVIGGAPAFSPDGRMLAFASGKSSTATDISMLPVTADGQAAGPPRALTSGAEGNLGPAWTADGREIVFRSSRGGPTRLWRMKISAPGDWRPVELAGDGGAWPSIARQGNRMVYQVATADANVWRRQAPATGETASSGAPICSSTKTEDNAAYSPDGRQIAFASDRSGHMEVWLSDSDCGHQRQATFYNTYSGSPSWSDDGEWIVYDSFNSPGWFDIYVMRADGGQSRRLTYGPARNAIGRFSHDGKWIYFSSMRTGRNEIWKVPFAGGDAMQVTKNGGWYSMESPAGKLLYYTKLDQSDDALWRMPVEGGPEELVLDSIRARNFTLAGKNVYYVKSESGKTTVQVLDLGARKSRVLFETSKPARLGLSVSPDQRWILYSQVDSSGSDLMLMENFR
jgi:Tol biopolymer transport system component/tRNA A-37 threonylcarbamoyl transferase component Bud32